MQNTKRYWLKFGAWFAIVHAISYLGYSLLLGEEINTMAGIPLVLMDFLAFIFVELTGGSTNHILFFIYGTLQWFLIGSILGWIYGKIKNRKRSI